MSLFNMDSEKVYNNLYWSNRYILNAGSMDDALVAAAAIFDIERAATATIATLTKYRVSTVFPHDDVYEIINKNLPGLHDIGSASLPLFCRVRVDFNVVGGGRPSRKYWCPPIGEAEQDNGVLNNTALTFYAANYSAPLLTVDAYVDVDNQAFSSATVFPLVAMRQLRRGSKKKLLPIIP